MSAWLSEFRDAWEAPPPLSLATVAEDLAEAIQEQWNLMFTPSEVRMDARASKLIGQEIGPYFQYGTIDGVIQRGGAEFKIVFPEPFKEAPLVFVTIGATSPVTGCVSPVLDMNTLSKTSVSGMIKRESSAAGRITNISYKLNWLAVGV